MINVDFADVRTVMSEMGMAMMGTGVARGDDRATAAAEFAVNNKLLEDINLSGACGILVNVTAGMDLTMHEFDEIGRTISEFAAEDATVVMGTVLDPEMRDEIRVTVVATGLNRVQPARMTAPVAPIAQPRVAIVRSRPGEADFGQPVSRPAAATLARGATATAAATAAVESTRPVVDDYLDIPAFLRRQAD